ncbi:acetolactate synthase [Legionella gratiana]|uniref:Acetolactate synthase n=1 Tax=Legionella gratiana TaxID=45066 RepID=A0A378JBE9_9GAMM|nr:thiamine pyrophosphate-binding protein [Legionella gratiana]KTD06386.1 acetolactate synthase [Legionella gratiana]STX45204.1 acetolactate synthase [Legionella gratiana]
MMTLADYLIRYLYENGVSHVFGVSGANIEDILDSIARLDLPLRFILAKHEFSAGCMADGYSRVSRSLGVVMSTSGGGALNLVPALGESLASEQPVLAIVGMPPQSLEGKGAFQDSSGLNGSLRGEDLFSALASKYFAWVQSVDDFPQQLQQAIRQALTPPFGTSILLIPKNLQMQHLAEKPEIGIQIPIVACDETCDSTLLETLLQICNKSKGSVLILVGEEIHRQNLENDLCKLVERLNARVAVTPEAKSAWSNESSRFVGVSGIAGHNSVLEAARVSRTIIVIGTRLQLMSRLGLEPYLDSKTIIYLNTSAPCYDFSNNGQYVHILSGGLKTNLQTLTEQLPVSDSLMVTNSGLIYEKTNYFDSIESCELCFESVFSLLNQAIHHEDIVFADAGNTGGAAIHYLKGASFFAIALGMGGMGYALGASIGSCLKSGQRTWCVLGDGALLMHGMEIHTAIQYGLPIRFIVFNNNAHAMCYDRDRLYLSGKTEANVFEKSQYGTGMAHMFPGFYSHDVNSRSDLRRHLLDLADYRLPALLSINLDYHEIPPFVPFLQRFRSIKT